MINLICGGQRKAAGLIWGCLSSPAFVSEFIAHRVFLTCTQNGGHCRIRTAARDISFGQGAQPVTDTAALYGPGEPRDWDGFDEALERWHLRNYDDPEVRRDLARKSYELFLKEWKENGHVHENYNATTGSGDDVRNSDRFYHWGALLGYVEYMEQTQPPPAAPPAR